MPIAATILLLKFCLLPQHFQPDRMPLRVLLVIVKCLLYFIRLVDTV
jgi:hypothetical protein